MAYKIRYWFGLPWLSFYIVSSQVAVHKVVEGGPRKCDSLWQGEGVKSMWRHAYKFLSYIWNLKFKVNFNFLL